MSFLKYLEESNPINARSANLIPFEVDSEHMEKGRWLSDCACGDKPDSKKEQELDQIFARLKSLLLDRDPSVDMEDEELEGEFMDDDVAAGVDDFGDTAEDAEEQNGVRRYVRNAHMVYKKRMPDGLFEELWIYNIGKETPNDEYKIRRDILGSTDIEPPETSSKDGTQSYSTWTAGNAQMLRIVGLPN